MLLDWTGTLLSYHECSAGVRLLRRGASQFLSGWQLPRHSFGYSNVAVPLTPALSQGMGSTVNRFGLEEPFGVMRPQARSALHRVELNRRGQRRGLGVNSPAP
jgi:hypothetical protein